MAYHVKFDMLCKLLPLYYPTWLTDFINDDKTWFNFDLNYEQLMQLMDMGYLKEIAPSRIAHVLPWITRIRNKEPKGNDTFNSELLLKRDITLKEMCIRDRFYRTCFHIDAYPQTHVGDTSGDGLGILASPLLV